MNRQQRRKAGRGVNGGIVPPHLQTAIRTGGAAGGATKGDASNGQAGSAKSPDGAPRKSLKVGMGGFDGLINQLAKIPLLVNRALPLIERGDASKAIGGLTDALIKVELAKASILGNLALAAMKTGDISAAIGYVDIAMESLTELALEETELGKMLAIVQASLPSDVAETPAMSPTATTCGGVSSEGAKGDAPAAADGDSAPAPTGGDTAPAPTGGDTGNVESR